jgi:predicted DNA-binding transcriptional regulator YafY
MAETLGQGRRSAERARDLVALHFDLDEILDGPRKRFRIRDSLRRHYTRPTAAELAALKAEIESLRQTGGVRFRELSSLLLKVQSSFDDREKRRIEPDLELLHTYQRSFVGPGPRADVSPEVWRTAVDAVMMGRCLEFDYSAAETEEPQWRKIVCAGLLNGPVSYVLGFIPRTDRAPALYRMDRMQNAFVSEDSATVPETFDLDEWLADSFGIWREKSKRIVLRILPDAVSRAREWRFHPRQQIEDLPDGGLRVSFRAGGLREIAEHLFQWAGQLVIEQPNALRNVMRDRLELAAAMVEHGKSAAK